MVEKVEKRKLYHVTADAPYKKALTMGQVITTSEAYNPFFGFYESPRTYPVNLPDGGILKVAAVKFLKDVRDGHLNCPNLADIAAEVTVHYVMLCRELIMEDVRLTEFDGEPPSRQRCLYLCETLEEAKQWDGRIGWARTICELTCTGIVHRSDASLLLADSEPLSVTRDRARAYWRGDVSEKPELETLFVGEAVVTGFGL